MDIPSTWTNLELDSLVGTLMIVGATDVGKSTFARYMFGAFRSRGRKVGYLDGDPGQSTMGPPTTLTITFNLDEDCAFSLRHHFRRYFIGSTTPRGHMLPTLVGAARLAQVAWDFGAEVLIYDTSGLVNPHEGGLALKNAKIELLRPDVVFAIQRTQELEPLLVSLRSSHRVKVVDLYPSKAVVRRDPLTRRRFRKRQYSRYFINSHQLVVDWTKIAVFPLPVFRLNRLVALEDNKGFTLGLGIVTAIDRLSRKATLRSPLSSLEGVNALRLGDILLNPVTYEEEKIR